MTVSRIREPRTYSADGKDSYFKDLIATGPTAQHMPLGFQSPGAAERLFRHRIECDVESEARTKKVEDQFRAAMDARGLEYRIAPNLTTGTGGDLAPPAWLIGLTSPAAQAASPLGDLMPSIPLPPGVQSINAPRIVVGEADTAQQVGGPEDSTDMTTSSAASNVVTISGDGVIAQQLLDLGGPLFDAALWNDLNLAYRTNREQQLINGTTSAGQLPGLASVIPTANAITSGTASIAVLWVALGQAFAQVGNNRGLPPEIWLMRSNRWGWIASQPDASTQLTVPPYPPMPDLDEMLSSDMAGMTQVPDPDPIANVLGLPTYLDGAIPQNLGSGLNQDQIFACRPSDMFLLESEPTFGVYPTGLSGTLQVRVRLGRYVAALVGRWPMGTASVTGAGMAVASGYS